MEISLKDRLVRYFKRRHGEWVASGDLQRIVMQATSYTPRTVVRRLQELQDNGELEVKYVKGHAWYRAKEKVDLVATNADRLAWFDSLEVK